jgi:mRNA-degrading endonuclease RelE of RelBE toxin-antitoxin system
MFKIEFTSEALDDMRQFKKYEKRKIIKEIEMQLFHQPMDITRNRKRLRPNDTAEWELRIGKYRVFYDVFEEHRVVKIEAVGFKKGNKLFIQGKEYQL